MFVCNICNNYESFFLLKYVLIYLTKVFFMIFKIKKIYQFGLKTRVRVKKNSYPLPDF